MGGGGWGWGCVGVGGGGSGSGRGKAGNPEDQTVAMQCVNSVAEQYRW